MTRRQALFTLGSGFATALAGLGIFLRKSSPGKEKAPVFFIGHGSPMNALEDNAFTQSLQRMRELCPAPQAILCISAHWETNGTWVTGMAKPETIHDFYGFPKALFDIQYPAPGSPEVAGLITAADSRIQISHQWGLDHGTWSVLRHIYPQADIPVLQLSLDLNKPPEYHVELGRQLRSLREQGVLIVGSGNLVHNLRQISWEANAAPFAWAQEFDEWVKKRLESRDIKSLSKEFLNSTAGRLSIPSLDHYYPLFYTLGAMDEKDDLQFTYEGIQNSSISMRTLVFGKS